MELYFYSYFSLLWSNCLILVYGIEIIVTSEIDDNNMFNITVVRQTKSLALYETATILHNNTRVLFLQGDKNNNYYERKYEMYRYERSWYTLVLQSSYSVDSDI